MQKKIFIISAFSLFILNSCEKELTTEQIVESVQKTISANEYGHYTQSEITKKVSVGEDSTRTEKNIDFYYKSIPSDTLIGFKIAALVKDGYHQVYNSEYLYGLTTWNKTLTITEKSKFPKKVLKLKNNYNGYPYFHFVNKALSSAIKNENVEITNLGIQKINSHDCYKLNVSSPNNNEKMSVETIYYVSKESYMPMGSDITITMSIGNAKEIMSFSARINSIDLESQIPEEQFTQEMMSEFNKVINYTSELENKPNTLLAIGENAPNWELSNSSGEIIKLSNLKGKVIIMDFWYKACAPCNRQMVKLQELHEKYSENSVKFIGINTIDDPIKDKIDLFLEKRNISMETVFNGKSIESAYQVTSSPALFVIDQNGKIVYNISGYTNNIIEELTNVIDKSLE